MFLNDQETVTDLLYYEAIAKTVVKLIRKTPESPVTIGVHGDWGAGKSSVLKMLEYAFAADDRVLCLWFNGWTFEGFEDAKTVVIETIVDELRRARPNSKKVADAAKKVLKRVDWLKLARKAGGFAFTATTGIPTFDQVKGIYDLATSFVEKPQDHISFEDLKGVAEKAGEFLKLPEESDNLPEHIHAFRNEFKELLDAADIEQLVVIVDDLDRCLPKTAISTLEAIRLFLFVERTAFVIGADELMIEYAVREHFPDLPPSSGPVSYARNYLEKLIQVPFRIPALGMAETRVYVTLLLAENALGSKDPRFLRLLAAAREDMKRPWKSRGLDRKTVETAMEGPVPAEVDQALIISAHLTRVLSEGTRGNPRQIKRFLNSMMLRHEIAEERGFGQEIQRPVLAKIMLAERFYPDFYEGIARLAANAPDGKPEALARFEAIVRALPADGDDEDERPAAKGARKAPRPKPAPFPPEAEEWLKNEWAKTWAAIDPPLADIDLRPYVFVTRDKRSSLGGLAAASHLEQLVDKLLGPPMMVRGAAAEIAKLSGPEPEEVFEAIRGRILQDDNFGTKPKGVDGLVRLVEAQPTLQRRLLEFIRELPVAKVGAWAASSWGTCFADPVIGGEFQTAVRGWAEQTENKVLQTTAQALGQMKRG